MATALCLYSILIVGLDSQVFPSVLTQIGDTPYQQGLVLASFLLLFPLSSIFAGLIADRIGKRIVLFFGALFLAIPFAISAAVTQLWIRVLALLLFGIGYGTVESQASALLTDIHRGKERSIVNLSQLFYSIGAAGGPFLIALAFKILPTLSVQRIFWTVTAVTSTVAIGFACIRETNTQEVPARSGGLRMVIGDPQGRLLLLIMFFYVAAELGTSGWLAKYAQVHLLLPQTIAPIAITLFWSGLGLSRAIVGFSIHRVPDTHILTVAFIISLIARIAAFLGSSPFSSMILFFIIGFGMGTVWPTLVAIIGARFKETSGSAVGLIIAVGGIASPIIHQIIGVVSREQLLGLRYTMLSLGIFTLINLCIIRKLSKLKVTSDEQTTCTPKQ
ncbi:MAG: MFS transporter [Spirochaetota bacterium]|nr:MAG: MFS transporter [Spirochaetota bacterium]